MHKLLSVLALPFLLAATESRSEVVIDTYQEETESLIGQPFLDVLEADVDGEYHWLSEYAGKGKWVLVDFWASWCGPCRAEMPNVVAAYEKYHDKGFDIVGYSFDTNRDNWLSAIKSLKMPWIHLSDLQGWESKAGRLYGINAIPDNILIDPDGIIVARDLRGPELEKRLSEIFQPSGNETLSRKLTNFLQSRR